MDPPDRRRRAAGHVLKNRIALSEHMDGELGAVMFKHACRMGLEGVVSKRRDRPYVAGRSTTWLKIKNPASAAARRVEQGSW
jgi:bifunctional non-homologous end joining protein LigD